MDIENDVPAILDRFLAVPRREVHVRVDDLSGLVRGALAGMDPDAAADLVGSFEEGFRRYVGSRHAIAMGSGRACLGSVLLGMGSPGRSEVVIPAYTDDSVPATIRSLGLKPVCADVRFPDGNLDPREVRRKTGPGTLAVVATHLFGRPCDVDGIRRICDRHGAIVIEDCAHALGARLGGRAAGTLGRAATFSFGETKPFTTFGGGIVVTDDDDLAGDVRDRASRLPGAGAMQWFRVLSKCLVLHMATRRPLYSMTLHPLLRAGSSLEDRLMRLYDRGIKPLGASRGMATRFSAPRAGVGLAALDRVEASIAHRIRLASILDEALGREPEPDAGWRDVRYFYVVTTPDRDGLARRLRDLGVDTGRRLMRNTARLVGDPEPYPVTERLVATSLQIPIHDGVSESTIRRVAECLARFPDLDRP